MFISVSHRTILLGLWVLWAYHPVPWDWNGHPMTVGWESLLGLSQDECFDALAQAPELVRRRGLTCVPAGILLRPVSVWQGAPSGDTIRPFAEWDIAPEFRP